MRILLKGGFCIDISSAFQSAKKIISIEAIEPRLATSCTSVLLRSRNCWRSCCCVGASVAVLCAGVAVAVCWSSGAGAAENVCCCRCCSVCDGVAAAVCLCWCCSVGAGVTM